jgi:hypothetical protein
MGYFSPEEHLHVWMRSSGAWLAADLRAGVLEACGSRHSIRECLPDYVREDATWEYMDSQRPDLAPWETTT